MGTQHSNPGPNGASHDETDEHPPVAIDHPTVQVDTDATNQEPQTAWQVIAGRPALVDLIDAILDYPPTRTFTATEVCEHADVSVQSFKRYAGRLQALGLIEGTDDGYRIDTESDVSQALFQLEGAVNAAGVEGSGSDQ